MNNELEYEIHTAVEIHDRFQDDGIGDTQYVRLDEVRAPSDGASRPEGVKRQDVEKLDAIRYAGEKDRNYAHRMAETLRDYLLQYADDGGLEDHMVRFAIGMVYDAGKASSAPSPTPIITEEMVENIARDVLRKSWERSVNDHRPDATGSPVKEFAERIIAILREQGESNA